MKRVRRGDIYYADLGKGIGHEQRGKRPVVVIQNDIGNKHSKTVIVAPMTRNTDEFITHVIVKKGYCREDSAIQLEQIRTIDKRRLYERVGHLPDEIMNRADEKILLSLGIDQDVKEAENVDKLTVIENGLIPVYQSVKGAHLVNMRELHKWLGVKKDFSDWVKYRIKQYDFIDGEDFSTILGKSTGGRPTTDYIFKLEPAKEIAMVENNEKGKQIRRYFIQVEEKFKQTSINLSQLSPEMRLFNQMFQAMAKAQLEAAETKRIAIEAKTGLEQAKQVISNIKETVISEPEQWRAHINIMFNKICEHINGLPDCNKYQDVRNETYDLLEKRAHIDLNKRLKNYKERLLRQGASKTIRGKANKLDIIDQDPKLREIYSQILKEYTIKYVTLEEVI